MADDEERRLLFLLKYREDEAILAALEKPFFQAQIMDVDRREQSTPIFAYLARGRNSLSVVRRLVELGGEVDGADRTGYTLLHYCALFDLPEIAEYLLLELNQFEEQDPRTRDFPINVATRKRSWKTACILDTYSGTLQRLLRAKFREQKGNVSKVKREHPYYPQDLLLFLNYDEPFNGMDFYLTPKRIEKSSAEVEDEPSLQKALLALDQIFYFASEEFLLQKKPWNILFNDIPQDIETVWTLYDTFFKTRSFRLLQSKSSKAILINNQMQTNFIARADYGVHLLPYEWKTFQLKAKLLQGKTRPNDWVDRVGGVFMNPGCIYYLHHEGRNCMKPRLYIQSEKDITNVINNDLQEEEVAHILPSEKRIDAEPPQTLEWNSESLSHTSPIEQQRLAAKYLAHHIGRICLNPGEMMVLDFDITTWMRPFAFNIVCNTIGCRPARLVLETAVRHDQGIRKTGHTKSKLLRTPFRPLACIDETALVDSNWCEVAKSKNGGISLHSKEPQLEGGNFAASKNVTLKELVTREQIPCDEEHDVQEGKEAIEAEPYKAIFEYISSCTIPDCGNIVPQGGVMKMKKPSSCLSPGSEEYIPCPSSDGMSWVCASISLESPQCRLSQGSRTFRLRSLEEEEPIFVRYFDIYASCDYSCSA